MFDESAVLDGLNEQQRRAATHQGGPLLVLAGAGTGLDVVRLDRNYRSRQGVLDLANHVRSSSPGLGLTLTGDRGAGMAPHLVRCQAGSQQE